MQETIDPFSILVINSCLDPRIRDLKIYFFNFFHKVSRATKQPPPLPLVLEFLCMSQKVTTTSLKIYLQWSPHSRFLDTRFNNLFCDFMPWDTGWLSVNINRLFHCIQSTLSKIMNPSLFYIPQYLWPATHSL